MDKCEIYFENGASKKYLYIKKSIFFYLLRYLIEIRNPEPSTNID